MKIFQIVFLVTVAISPAFLAGQAPNNTNNTEEVRSFLSRLTELGDEQVQSRAEELSAKILADLQFRPAIEAHNARIQTWLSLQDAATKRKEEVANGLVRLRQQLKSQIAAIDEQQAANPELAESRKRNVIESYWEPIRDREEQLSVLENQITTLSMKIKSDTARGEIQSDNWQLAVEIVESSQNAIVLPTDIENIWGTRFSLSSSEKTKQKTSPAKTAQPRSGFPQDSMSTTEMLAKLGVKQ